MKKSYEYYLDIENINNEVFETYDNDDLDIKLYTIKNPNIIKKIYSILSQALKVYKVTEQENKCLTIKRCLKYLKLLEKSDAKRLYAISYKVYTTDSYGYIIDKYFGESDYVYEYSGNIPNRIMKTYCNNYLKFKTFKIIKCGEKRYLFANPNNNFNFYNLIDFWDTTEETDLKYDPSIMYAFSLKKVLKRIKFFFLK